MRREQPPSRHECETFKVKVGRVSWFINLGFFPDGRIGEVNLNTSKAGQDERPELDGIQHPTVKPLDLMRYLVGLVTREGDSVLEPFAGSGTTIAACVGLGRNVTGIELNPDYVRLIEKRMQSVTPSLFGGE